MMRVIFLTILCFWASSALAQDRALEAGQMLADAQQSLRAADTANDRVAALTETVRAYEFGLIAMRDGLRQAEVRKLAVENHLNAKRAEVAQLLGVLQSIGQAPGPLLLLHPNGPMGTARSGMITADITPALNAEALELRAELEELSILNKLQQNAAGTLTEGLDGAQTARSALSEAIAQRDNLPRRFEDDPVQTALLLASTETLDAFASGLTDAFSLEDNVVYSTNVKGALDMPMRGTIIRGFEVNDAEGNKRPGLTIAGRPRALVTSPTPATILFVGPLLDYGNVVILEPAPDVLFVLSGLAEIYGRAGQVIPEAFPIGLLGGEQPEVDAILTESDRGTGNISTQTLYLEVREGQTPVDPTTWFVLD
jgi:septal ring factor EnvC (AmiA/AmiB activator)